MTKAKHTMADHFALDEELEGLVITMGATAVLSSLADILADRSDLPIPDHIAAAYDNAAGRLDLLAHDLGKVLSR